MGLNKRTYTDQVTVITAENLNDIQDEVIANGTAITQRATIANVTAGTEATANYHLGFYLDANGDLCQVDS